MFYGVSMIFFTRLSARCIVILALMSSPSFSASADDSAKTGEIFARALKAYEQVRDYRCTFHKKESVNGKIINSRAEFRFKKPFCAFYKESEGQNKDIACVYIAGKNDNKLATKNTGILGLMTINLDPEGNLAMKGNRHPVTHLGIGYILDSAKKDIEKARKNGNAIFTYEGEKNIYGRKVHATKAIYPENSGYYGHIVNMCYDAKTALPVRITVYDWKNEFMEEYGYEDVRLDTGLGDSDFSL